MRNRLCKEIESAIGQRLRTPKDFDYLRNCIYARLRIIVSSTTLKRLWGYLNDGGEPREATLTTLCRFLGYRDWENFVQSQGQTEDLPSSPVLCRRLNVITELKKNDCLRLTWQPKRWCDVIYLGNLQFLVTASENTRLKQGDTFQCSLIIEGEPLYLDGLRQGSLPPVAYVCGKKNGVRFEKLINHH